MRTVNVDDLDSGQDALAALRDLVDFPEGRGPMLAFRADARARSSFTLVLEDGSRLYWPYQSDLLKPDPLWEPFALRLKLRRPEGWRKLAEDVQLALLQLADTWEPTVDDSADMREWLDAYTGNPHRPVILLAPAGSWLAISALRAWTPGLDVERRDWHCCAPVWETDDDTRWLYAEHFYDHVAAHGGPRAPGDVASMLRDLGVQRRKWQAWDPHLPRSKGGGKRQATVFRLPLEPGS